MSATRIYLCLISVLIIFSIALNFLSESIIIQIFFYSLIFHVLFVLYIICSFLEINVFHEKQGSKLDLSKSKLSK